MKFKRPASTFSNQRGFTLVELLMVIGILGMLAAIAVQQITVSRTRSFDSQAHTMMRNVLTVAAIDTPQGADTFGVGGTLVGVGFPDVELPPNVCWNVANELPADRWRFYFAHPSGIMGYYFWVPGDTYNGPLDTDGSGNRSDKIFEDKNAASYRFDANCGLP